MSLKTTDSRKARRSETERTCISETAPSAPSRSARRSSQNTYSGTSRKLLSLNFAAMCDGDYGLMAALNKKDGQQKKKIQALLECFSHISKYSWEQFCQLGKFRGGPETVPLAECRDQKITEPLEKLMPRTEDSVLLSIRFGQEQYRLLAWHSMEEPSVLYVLAADWDHSLYNHGS